MKYNLFLQAVSKFLLGTVFVAVLIFLPAGTLDFPNGWLFMGLLFIPMFIAGIIMLQKNPELLRKRLAAKETQKEQRTLMKLSGLVFVLGFATAGLHFRFGWHPLPKGISIGAAGIFLLSYGIYGEVLRENTYLSRTIEVQENQTVIDTGLYGIVRHPMYTAVIFLFLSIPLILGSIYSFILFLTIPVILAKRIIHEEQFLEQELHGYSDYKRKVKYRLIPFVW